MASLMLTSFPGTLRSLSSGPPNWLAQAGAGLLLAQSESYCLRLPLCWCSVPTTLWTSLPAWSLDSTLFTWWNASLVSSASQKADLPSLISHLLTFASCSCHRQLNSGFRRGSTTPIICRGYFRLRRNAKNVLEITKKRDEGHLPKMLLRGR